MGTYLLTYDRLPLYAPLPPSRPPPGYHEPGLEERIDDRQIVIIDVNGDGEPRPKKPVVIEWDI